MLIFFSEFLRSFRLGRRFGAKKRTHAGEILATLEKMIAEAPKEVVPPSVLGPHTYELMIPCGHGQPIKVEGAGERASFASLRDSIKELIFVFKGTARDVADFYFLDDYFVVSTRMLDFLTGYCNALEFVPIRVRFENGNICEDEYVAVSIPPSIDCIDPNGSLGYEDRLGANDALSFSELSSNETDTDVSIEGLAGSGGSGYAFPKEHRIKSICLNEALIPDECVLFRPRYSPGFLIVSSKFANRLRFEIKGGTSGYHFWTLDLNRVSESLSETFRWYR